MSGRGFHTQATRTPFRQKPPNVSQDKQFIQSDALRKEAEALGWSYPILDKRMNDKSILIAKEGHQVAQPHTAEAPLTISHPHKKRTLTKKEKKALYFSIRARRELRKRIKRKRHGKKERLRLYPKKRDVFISVTAPINFSFIKNTEEVLEYFRIMTVLISERNQVEFDLKDIKNLTPDAIALLIAKIKDIRFTRGLMIKGNKPLKKPLNRIFEESGFLDHVKSAYVPPKNDNHLLIHQVTRKKVDSEIAKKVCERAVEHTFKQQIKFQPIYKIIIECMANTDNHASLNEEVKYDWWLFTYCEPDTGVTSFTFLDLGVGIFNINPISSYKDSLLTKIENITRLNLKDNMRIVPDLFSGQIYTSKTKDRRRGQGLPDIKALSSNKNIKNFTIITNNVKVELPSLKATSLKNKLNGTLLYWELHP